MHLPILIQDLALILSLAGASSILCYYLKQPLVVGYILSGILAGPHVHFIPTVQDPESINVWAEIGIIFLFFSLGLDFHPSQYVGEGKKGLFIALLSILFSVLCGAFLAAVLHLTQMETLVFGIAVAISSTVFVVRSLDSIPKLSHNIRSLSYAILIVQDIFAVIALGWLLYYLSGINSNFSFLGVLICLLASALILFLIGKNPVQNFCKNQLAKLNREAVIIIFIGICFGVGLLFTKSGLSSAIGAFASGMALGRISPFNDVQDFFDPVKNLFLAIFFVSIGMAVEPELIYNNLASTILLSLSVIIIKVLTIYLSARLVKMDHNPAIILSACMAQVGEFSILIILAAINLKLISPRIYPQFVAISFVTCFVAPYLIKLAAALQRKEKTL